MKVAQRGCWLSDWAELGERERGVISKVWRGICCQPKEMPDTGSQRVLPACLETGLTRPQILEGDHDQNQGVFAWCLVGVIHLPPCWCAFLIYLFGYGHTCLSLHSGKEVGWCVLWQVLEFTRKEDGAPLVPHILWHSDGYNWSLWSWAWGPNVCPPCTLSTDFCSLCYPETETIYHVLF